MQLSFSLNYIIMRIKEMGRFLLWITGKSLAITLFPFGIYVNKVVDNRVSTLNHETIHWQQQKEMLCIFFYLWYGIEWLIKLPKYGKLAYWAISFEREAYYYDLDNNYLKRRKSFAWFKFINHII